MEGLVDGGRREGGVGQRRLHLLELLGEELSLVVLVLVSGTVFFGVCWVI